MHLELYLLWIVLQSVICISLIIPCFCTSGGPFWIWRTGRSGRYCPSAGGYDPRLNWCWRFLSTAGLSYGHLITSDSGTANSNHTHTHTQIYDYSFKILHAHNPEHRITDQSLKYTDAKEKRPNRCKKKRPNRDAFNIQTHVSRTRSQNRHNNQHVHP